MNARLLWTVGLIAFGLWWLKRLFAPNELTSYFEEQKALQRIGADAGQSSLGSLESVPLATIGDTPYSGVHLDPFNPRNPASQPKSLDMYNSLPMNESLPVTGPWLLTDSPPTNN